MSRALVLDTNVLPLWRGLDGPLWLSIRKLCEIADVAIFLPEIVLKESLNLRRSEYDPAAARYLAAYAELSKFFDLGPVFVPDSDSVVDQWDVELRAAFAIVPAHGEDAVEALDREAVRKRPARAGKGARDSAIWLTAVRLTQTHENVFFVSKNTADFASDKRGTLHPDLAADRASVGDRIQYLTSVNQLIAELAERAEVAEIHLPLLRDAIVEDAHSLLLQATSMDERYLDLGPEDLSVAEINLKDCEVQQAYSIQDRELALVRLTGEAGVTDRDPIAFTMRAWVELSPLTKLPVTAEAQGLELSAP